ncbi:MAG TPA: electron transport complex subunit RsxE [Anaerohalosphaeraceae bacterium]|jgi:electron transport complex protein RnfE|nr:electron transport complex subunit RsxE [Anaerohalosphaeraceae bacterium]
MSKENTMTVGQAFIGGVWTEIPVLRLMLGLCPTLAVTTSVKAGLTMGLCVIFVLICSNFVVSSMRHLLKPHLRIMIFTLTIAVFVTIADMYLKAFQPVMSEKLGPYIPLIIVNCIIICRAEACAAQNGLLVSVVDGFAMGLGFTIVLCFLASIREVLATGCITFSPTLVLTILKPVEAGGWFTPWASMLMPIGAFVTLGLMLAAVNQIAGKKS